MRPRARTGAGQAPAADATALPLKRESPAGAGLSFRWGGKDYSFVAFFTATFLAGALATDLVAFFATGDAEVPVATATVFLRALP